MKGCIPVALRVWRCPMRCCALFCCLADSRLPQLNPRRGHVRDAMGPLARLGCAAATTATVACAANAPPSKCSVSFRSRVCHRGLNRLWRRGEISGVAVVGPSLTSGAWRHHACVCVAGTASVRSSMGTIMLSRRLAPHTSLHGSNEAKAQGFGQGPAGRVRCAQPTVPVPAQHWCYGTLHMVLPPRLWHCVQLLLLMQARAGAATDG
jgi:hypothetical protein